MRFSATKRADLPSPAGLPRRSAFFSRFSLPCGPFHFPPVTKNSTDLSIAFRPREINKTAIPILYKNSIDFADMFVWDIIFCNFAHFHRFYLCKDSVLIGSAYRIALLPRMRNAGPDFCIRPRIYRIFL